MDTCACSDTCSCYQMYSSLSSLCLVTREYSLTSSVVGGEDQRESEWPGHRVPACGVICCSEGEQKDMQLPSVRLSIIVLSASLTLFFRFLSLFLVHTTAVSDNLYDTRQGADKVLWLHFTARFNSLLSLPPSFTPLTWFRCRIMHFSICTNRSAVTNSDSVWATAVFLEMVLHTPHKKEKKERESFSRLPILFCFSSRIII